MPITTNKGAMAVTVADTTGKGLYAADGSRRVTLVSGVSYVGLHAADSSLNVVLDSTGTGRYHISGALRGSDKGATGLYTESGGINMSGLNVPSQLFSASEPGVWYDPSDLTTLFQDSAGTTPVTAPAQPVGLMLSKDKGLVIGPEFVTNGDFSGGTTGWTAASSATLSVNGGSLVITNGATAFGYAFQAVTTVIGRYYSVSFSITGGSSTGSLFIGTTSGGFENYNSPNRGVGTYQVVFLATATTTYFRLGISVNTSGATVNFDNISVKSFAGNHATQSTSASRPTYGIVPATGRRNLVTFSEQFDNAAWSKAGGGTGSAPVVTANAGTSPAGTTTADRIVLSKGANNTLSDFSSIEQSATLPSGSGVASIYMRSFDGSSSYSVGLRSYQTGGELSVVTVTGDWQRFDITSGSGTAHVIQLILRGTYGTSNSADILAWGAQVEAGSTTTDYQKVVTAFEVTEANVASLSYLSFDGIDDFMVTPTITPGIDKVQVFAGVRTLSFAAESAIAELGATATSGEFRLSTLATANYRFSSRGTSFTQANAGGYVAPIQNILTGIGDISGDTATIRVNGTQAAQSTGDQGTGNYLAYPLYIGRRAGTSLPFNGQLYGLAVRFGSNLDEATIARNEKWMGIKTGVTV